MNQLTLVEESPSAGTRHPVAAGATIGREDCEIVLADSEVSRRHATIRALDDTLAIEDLGSTNGTFVNGQRLTGVSALKDGDVIKMANSTLRVEAQVDAGATRLRPIPAAPAEPEPPAPPPPPPAPAAAESPAPPPPVQSPPPPTPPARQPPAPPPPAPPQPAAAPPSPPAAAQPTELGRVRGDVPAPEPASASRVHQAVNPAAAPSKHSFDAGGTGGTRRGSAATRVEATVVAYVIVVATAIGVILYILAEKV
ncbi:MAG: FHA domain-containing protein [Actinomycetota bacterium]